jgi:ferredoxin-NADP reductase
MRTDDLIAPPFPKSGLPVYPLAPRQLRLMRRVSESPDTVTYDFEVVGDVLRHLPGQAIALDLPMGDGIATRSFTIASGGQDPQRLSVTVKSAADGYATRWMQDNLHPDAEITSRGPFGRFTLAGHPRQPLLLIGGGSGFTPMMSMLRWLHARGETVDVTVVQIARHSEDLLFGAELNKIAAQMPNLSLYDVVTSPRAGEVWRGYRGRPDRAMMRALVPDAAQRVVFCCGPTGFMEHIRMVLAAQGVAADRFLTESFGGLAAPPPQSASVDGDIEPSISGSTPRTVAVSYRGQVFDLSPDGPLSAALAAKGQRIPTGCGQGQCGTCRLKLVEGDVEMHHQGGLSPREVQEGYILACCSRPKGPLRLADPA